MMHFNTRAKSAILATAMIISSSTSCIEFSNPFAGIGSYVGVNKTTALSVAVLTLLALKVRLDTKPRGTYSYDNWSQDIIDLLSSYNIFDAESRATIMHCVDKYLVGSKFKKDEYTIRTKEEDGSVVAVKRNKVTQKPSGFMGCLDAYVLQQLKINTELITPAVMVYLLVTNSNGVFGREINKYFDVKLQQCDKCKIVSVI